MITPYSLIELNEVFITQGLTHIVGREFSIRKKNYPKEDIKLLVDYIVGYIEEEKKQIRNLETFGCGSWMIQFVFDPVYIQLYELKNVENGKNIYEFDLTITINLFRSQVDLCEKYNVPPTIPAIGQKIAISKEIYEGYEVNGVRYNAPVHMTGWYLTSNSYNGDIASLVVDHLYHILKERPELAKFLALPVGYRFYKDRETEEVWYDIDA